MNSIRSIYILSHIIFAISSHWFTIENSIHANFNEDMLNKYNYLTLIFFPCAYPRAISMKPSGCSLNSVESRSIAFSWQQCNPSPQISCSRARSIQLVRYEDTWCARPLQIELWLGCDCHCSPKTGNRKQKWMSVKVLLVQFVSDAPRKFQPVCQWSPEIIAVRPKHHFERAHLHAWLSLTQKKPV